MEKVKKKKAKKSGEAAAGTETPVEEVDTDSESNLDSPIRPAVPTPAQENLRAKKIYLGTAYKGCMSLSLNSFLSNMGKEEAQEFLQELRANRDSPMIKTKANKMFWSRASGCTFVRQLS